MTSEGYFLKKMMKDWERCHRMCVVQLLCLIVHVMHLMQLHAKITYDLLVDGDSVRKDYMQQQLM